MGGLTCIVCGGHDDVHLIRCARLSEAIIATRSLDNQEGVRQRMARDIEKGKDPRTA